MKKVSQSASLTYKLEFKKSALKEWQKLGATLQRQFKKKLIERLNHPHVPASKLSAFSATALSIISIPGSTKGSIPWTMLVLNKLRFASSITNGVIL